MSVGATNTTLTAIAEAVKNHLAKREAAAAAKQAGATDGGTGPGGVINSLTVEVHPVESLNYAMLHNNRSVFEQFTIKNLTPGAGSIRIVVDLFQGELSVPYKGIIPFTGLNHTVNLNDDAGPSAIRLPLASSLMRSLKEPLRTTMLVQITDTAETVKFLYEQTFPVTLLPVDQWRDTDSDRQWLPSFVQQRDPVIVQIIQQAQKYLMAIQDDAGAGFDGYQSVDPEDKDGFLTLDVQVQAIWAALQYDYELHYINPPPAYRKDSQRLRMPSEVITSKRGTCIDLAILLASCLEAVDIYPVVFLLKEHAFPGYWRSETFHKQFLDDAVTQTRAKRTTGSWHFEKDEFFLIIREAVAQGHLVPLETVRLTDHGSFRTSLDQGLENLRSPVGFDAMIDIQLARENGITPIPLTGDY
jgi:hypothetical protein